MIFEAADFVFEPPRQIAFARRVLVKPSARCSAPHPVTTSRQTLGAIIAGIRKISSADIIFLERSDGTEPMRSVYRELGYDFPRTMLLDVDQCVPVAIENPLPKPFALPTFWVPNVILSCDFLITVAPLKTVSGRGDLSIRNLLGLLPVNKYTREMKMPTGLEQGIGIESVIADLYFTLPFDLGVIDARKRLISETDSLHGESTEYGKIFVGTPYEVDKEASEATGVQTGYLKLIEQARAEQRRSVDSYGNQQG
ncbi:MAG: DUF362 domain-containing protein [Dehalococcoidia bacterium]|nr:DUF362 domain-containing protein [Dehalococcoidia bacterium]